MLTSVSKGRAFEGTLALTPTLRWVWLERYADAITDTVGQPLSKFGRYSGQNVAFLSRRSSYSAAGRYLWGVANLGPPNLWKGQGGFHMLSSIHGFLWIGPKGTVSI